MTSAYIMMGLLIAFVSIVSIYEAKIKGYIGEKAAVSKLGELTSQYKVINDILIRTAKGTTQIDHVVVSSKGIFVIETKNYDGWIYGSDNQKNWIVSKYGKEHKFYNPVWQNKGHVKALMELLKTDKEKIFHTINDNQLKDLISKMPRSKEELQTVDGFGETKANKYGDDILEIIKKY